MQRALETSEKAQPGWQALPAHTRALYIYAIADKIKEKREHFARLLVMEQGKTYPEALGEVDDTIRYMTYSAEAARRIQGSIFPSDAPNVHLAIHKVPYGVTVGLCAFNYPLALIGRKGRPGIGYGQYDDYQATRTDARNCFGILQSRAGSQIAQRGHQYGFHQKR